MTSQPASNSKKPDNIPRVYKVGVYGRSSSGKTCLLAALAMSASSHQNAVTCDLVVAPPGYVPPEGLQDNWDRSAHNVQYKLGLDWIQGAIKSLKAGQVPKPNDPDGIYRYLFDFTSPEMRTRRVELTDYAGELVKAGVTPQEVAAQLKNHLKDLDCLLVIAETPQSGHESEQLANELSLLRQAFTELKSDLSVEQTVPFPTALILTKWDRRRGKRVPTLEELPGQLKEMLENAKTSPLRGLRDVLANSVLKHEDVMFETFAVSALGPCELVSVEDVPGRRREIERPCTPMPLASFGVQEPFIWLVRRRDSQELEEWKRRLAWPGVLWRSFWGLWRALQMNRLRKRYHTNSSEARLIRSFRDRSVFAGILQLAFFVLFLAGIESLWDAGKLRTVESSLADRAQVEQWHRSESWLEEYANSADCRHSLTRRFFSRDDARRTLRESHEKHEALLWDPVAAAPDLASKLRPAEVYVGHFDKPDRPGLHQREAQDIVAQAPWVREMKKVDSAATEAGKIALLERITKMPGFERSAIFDPATKLYFTLKKSVGEKVNEEKLTEVRNRLAEVKAKGRHAPQELIDQVRTAAYDLPPLPEAESAELRTKRLEVRQTIDDIIADTIKDAVLAQERKDFNGLRAKYDSLMDDADFTKAAEFLTDPINTRKFSDKSLIMELVGLKEAFPKKATGALKAVIVRDLEAHKLKDAGALLKRFGDSPSIAKLFRGNEALEEECKGLKHVIGGRHDRFLYDTACRARTKQTAQDYVDDAPLQTMAKEMTEMVGYKKKELGDVSVENLKLTVRKIYWRTYFNANKDNRLRIWCDEASLYDDVVSSVAGKDTDPEVSVMLPKLKLNEPIKIEVWITRSSNFLGGYGAELAAGSEKRSVVDWNGKVIQVNGGSREVDVTLTVENLPKEPELPTWRNK